MLDLIINLIIVLLICGFLYWVYLKLIPLVPVPEPFKGAINALVLILIGAFLLFYVVIPLLRMLPRALH